jgi:hemolysin activation/secretion protein
VEEYSVGNYTVGRGYDAGLAAGDHAFAARIEPRLKLGGDPRLIKEAFAFYDHVNLRNLDPFSEQDSQRLSSLGAGLRVSWPGKGMLEAIYARPLARLFVAEARKSPSRLLVSGTIAFR